MDHQVNRILDAIEETGEMDNTLVIYLMGDNGASAEGSPDGLLNEMTFFNNIPVPFEDTYARIDELGGPNTFGHYPVGWAHAMDTPFQWTKQIASHFGGTRNGLAIAWPAVIKDQGSIRSQFHHVIDIVPTILEATELPAPISINGIAQSPIEGTSMVYSFDKKDVPSTRRTQYFEMFGNRAIYSDGWVAATKPLTVPWSPIAKKADPVHGWEWELYHVEKDFSQSDDLAAKHPEKLEELKLLFYGEAKKYNVLPIDSTKVPRLDVSLRPSLTEGRSEFTYFDNMKRIPEGTAPDFKNKSHIITVEVEIPENGADGMLVTQGGRFGGMGTLHPRWQTAVCLQPSPTSSATASPAKRNSPPASTRSATNSHTTAAAPARAEPAPSSWTTSRSRRRRSSARWDTASRWMKPSTSAPTPVNRSARTTTCRSTLKGNSTGSM